MPEEEAVSDRPESDAPTGRARWRRYAVPAGLGAVVAVAGSVAAVLISGAQGWQAPALAPTGGGAVAIPAASPEPVEVEAGMIPVAQAPAVLEGPAGKGRLAANGSPARPRRLALRPAATPVMAPAGLPLATVTGAASPSEPGAPAGLPEEAGEPQMAQMSQAEADAIERRNLRRAAREGMMGGGPARTGMGLRGALPTTNASATVP